MESNLLIKKLRIKEGQHRLIISTDQADFDILKNLDLNFDIEITDTEKEYNWIMLFVKDQSSFENIFRKIYNLLLDDGYLWICFPKKSSKIQTDLTRDTGWEILEDYPQLVFNTLISLNDIWSAFALKKTSKEVQKDIVKPKYQEYIDTPNRKITIPEDLERLFLSNNLLKVKFRALSFTNQKEIVLSLLTAKTVITKTKRLEIIEQKLIDLG